MPVAHQEQLTWSKHQSSKLQEISDRYSTVSILQWNSLHVVKHFFLHPCVTYYIKCPIRLLFAIFFLVANNTSDDNKLTDVFSSLINSTWEFKLFFMDLSGNLLFKALPPDNLTNIFKS